jgi:pimeloyl-ACP methyl ester carboxylesterase
MQIEIEPGVRLFVDIEGAGLVPDGAVMRDKPTLLLLHGGPGYDHSSFKPLFSQLADVAQLVYVDHRGHGRSTRRPPAEWTLDTFADDIVRLCHALGITQPVVLGQSFGGFVAQRYLARHPQHPARVILSSTSHHLGLQRKLDAFERLGGAAARDAAQAFWTAPGEATWERYQQLCTPLYNTRPAADPLARGRTVFNTQILFASAGGEQQTMQLLPGLAAVCCPVLVLAGDTDPVTPLADAQEIAAAIPAPWGRLVTIADAGHGTWRDQPEAAMRVIREFVADQPPG